MKDRDYREKTVKGMVATGLIPKFCDVAEDVAKDLENGIVVRG